MSLGAAGWVIWIVYVVFVLLSHFGVIGGPYAAMGGGLILFVLVSMLMWQVWGPPIRR